MGASGCDITGISLTVERRATHLRHVSCLPNTFLF